MTEITLDFRGEQLMRLRFIGEVDDDVVINSFRVILELMPHVRDWPTIADLREYTGKISWGALVRIAELRGRRPAGPRNRTALIADKALYHDLAWAMNDVWFHRIARRVEVFETEAEARAWLDRDGG